MKKMMSLVCSVFLYVFYLAIIMYVFFAIVQIHLLANFAIGMAFQLIGFLALAFLLFCNFFNKPLKPGFAVPLIAISVIYTFILDFINIAWIALIECRFFFLIHFVLLFLYGVVSLPMYIMGRR